MSENNISIEEYTRRYANNYCGGDVEESRKHAIVKEVVKEKQQSNNE